MFICGTGNFSDGERDTTPGPRRSKRPCRIIGKDNRNPYADRGLDKFYALLADLDDRKQKIYTRLGSEDISFVRFVYSNDEANHIKPIVVKAKERSREKGNTGATNFVKHLANSNNPIRGDEVAVVDKKEIVPEQISDEEKKKKKKKKRYLRCKGSFSLESFRQPYWYFLAIVALIMVSLAVFGRSFAILCTSIGWYLVPSVGISSSSPSSPSSSSANERKPKRKKELLSRLSERKMNVQSEDPSSPRSVINGLSDQRKVQKQHHGQKKKLLKISSI